MQNWQITLLCICFLIIGLIIGYVISYIRNSEKRHNKQIDYMLETTERIDSNIFKMNNNYKKAVTETKKDLDNFESSIEALDLTIQKSTNEMLEEIRKPVQVKTPDLDSVQNQLNEVKIKLDTISERLRTMV